MESLGGHRRSSRNWLGAGHVGRELHTGSEKVAGIGIRDCAIPRQARHAPRPRRCWVVKSDSSEGPGYL